MKRLRIFIIIFCVFLSVPLGYFILRTHQSLDQEEMAELRYFADTLFFEMEKELADFIEKEESRYISRAERKLYPRIFSKQSGWFFSSPHGP